MAVAITAENPQRQSKIEIRFQTEKALENQNHRASRRLAKYTDFVVVGFVTSLRRLPRTGYEVAQCRAVVLGFGGNHNRPTYYVHIAMTIVVESKTSPRRPALPSAH